MHLFESPAEKHHENVALQKNTSTKRKIKKATVGGLKFLFSTVGLIILTFAWLLLGGAVFQRLETPFENSVSDGIKNIILKNVKDTVYNITRDHFQNTNQTQSKEDLYKRMDDELVVLTAEIYKAIRENGWNGELNPDKNAKQWSYPNAVLYSATVVTTIGYGHITPKTKPGRILTIVYALIGIPITLVTLAKIGHVMGVAFRFIYTYLNRWFWKAVHKVCPCCLTRCCKKKGNKNTKASVVPTTNDPAKEGTADPEDINDNARSLSSVGTTVDLSDMTSVRTAATTVRTYMTSDQSSKNTAPSTAEDVAIVTKTAPDASAAKSATQENQTSEKKPGFFQKCCPCLGASNASQQTNGGVATQVGGANPEDPDPKKRTKIKTRDKMKQYRRLKRKIARDEAKEQIRVPISISFVPVVAYVLFGSWMFSFLNAEWSYLVGCYFCFITISTIGFGDFVFGHEIVAIDDAESWTESIRAQKSLILTCFYILIGLSLNSMCIDLVAFEITQKVRQLGLFLGFIKPDDGNASDEEE